MDRTKKILFFLKSYLPNDDFQNEVFIWNSKKKSTLMEVLNDLLLWNFQIEKFEKIIKKGKTILLEKRKQNILQVQTALEKGVDSFLEHEFKFSKDVFLAKSIFDWSDNSFNKGKVSKEIYDSKGEHYYLLTYSFLKNKVCDIYLSGFEK